MNPLNLACAVGRVLLQKQFEATKIASVDGPSPTPGSLWAGGRGGSAGDRHTVIFPQPDKIGAIARLTAEVCHSVF